VVADAARRCRKRKSDMVWKRKIPGALALLVVALSGCDSITDPQLVTSFDWTEVPDPQTVTEGISTSVAFGDLFILGQVITPARCYELQGTFAVDAGKLTVRVTARSNGSPNCDEREGGFRYTATMSNLAFRTYELTVIHEVDDGTGGQYTKTVVIR
jgi:hypothetical protein